MIQCSSPPLTPEVERNGGVVSSPPHTQYTIPACAKTLLMWCTLHMLKDTVYVITTSLAPESEEFQVCKDDLTNFTPPVLRNLGETPPPEMEGHTPWLKAPPTSKGGHFAQRRPGKYWCYLNKAMNKPIRHLLVCKCGLIITKFTGGFFFFDCSRGSLSQLGIQCPSKFTKIAAAVGP